MGQLTSLRKIRVINTAGEQGSPVSAQFDGLVPDSLQCMCSSAMIEGDGGSHLWFCLQHWHLGHRSFGTTFLPGSFGRLLLGILSASLPLSASLQSYRCHLEKRS